MRFSLNLLSPKWDHDRQDGELIDDPRRIDWDTIRSRNAYEDGMARAFRLVVREH